MTASKSQKNGNETGYKKPPVQHQFKAGNPGRPKGSRNKLGEQFVSDLQADWEENGKQVIEAVRSEKPDVYMKVIASILPKDLNVNVNKFDDLSDEELIHRLRSFQDYIAPFLVEGSDRDGGGVETPTAH